MIWQQVDIKEVLFGFIPRHDDYLFHFYFGTFAGEIPWKRDWFLFGFREGFWPNFCECCLIGFWKPCLEKMLVRFVQSMQRNAQGHC